MRVTRLTGSYLHFVHILYKNTCDNKCETTRAKNTLKQKVSQSVQQRREIEKQQNVGKRPTQRTG